MEEGSHCIKRMEDHSQMEYGTQDWIPLKNIKESNPVEIVEYADANNLLV